MSKKYTYNANKTFIDVYRSRIITERKILYITTIQAAAMKNKFWMENLKAIIAGSVVGLLVLGLIYWKFFMPQPPPPGYGPPAGGAPGGGEGSTTQTRSHKHSKKNRLSAVSLTIKINTTPHIQIQTIHRNTDIQ